MDLKLKKKDVLNENKKVISIGYCSLQYLLRYQDRIGYTTGVYGWNADVYEFDNVVIVTGYRPFGEGIDSKLVQDYEKKARKIVFDYDLDYDKQRQRINRLLNNFLKKVVA